MKPLENEDFSPLKAFLLEVCKAESFSGALAEARRLLVSDETDWKSILTPLLVLAAWYGSRKEGIGSQFSTADQALLNRLPVGDQGIFVRAHYLIVGLRNDSDAGRESLSLLLRVAWEVSALEKKKREAQGSGARSL